MSDRARRPVVECVSAVTMMVREDSGAPKCPCLVVDWGGDLAVAHRTGETTDSVLDQVLRDGWALATHPDQDCPVVDTYCMTVDRFSSATVVGPGDPPRVRLINLAVQDGQWPDVSWGELARKLGVVRIIAGNIGLSAGTAPGLAFEQAVRRGAVAVADIPVRSVAKLTR